MDKAQEKQLAQEFGYLYDRWQDEHEYEDFAEYRGAFRAKLPPGTVLNEFRSKPFHAEFTTPDGVRRFVHANARYVDVGVVVQHKVTP